MNLGVVVSLHKEMADYFDSLAPEWGNRPSKYGIREKLTAMMKLPPGSVIADIGCGKGVMFDHLLRTNPAKLIAVDISGEMLRSAQNLFSDSRIEYINEDFFDARLPMIDAAVLFNSYPHFLDKGALAQKLAQVINGGGMLVIAHSRGKSEINGGHQGEGVAELSAPLEDAEAEADKFGRYFKPDVLIDNDEIYFIKMLRK